MDYAKIFKGKWRNELKSILTITNIDKRGYFEGRYQTADSIPGNDGKKIDSSRKFPVVGFISDDIISFSVNYSENESSLCSFLGHIYQRRKKTHIKSLWLLGGTTLPVNDDSEATALWASVRTGSDTFTKLSS